MKKRINPKLPAFTAIIVFYILIFNGSCRKDIKRPDSGKTTIGSSKIIYTDVNPDSVIINTSRQLYNLDLDNDGVTDFVFTEEGRPTGTNAACRNNATGTEYVADVKPASGSNNDIIYESYVNLARPLDSLSVIDANASWTSDTLNKLLYVIITGPAANCLSPEGIWNHYSDAYLGLKFIKNGNTYYGWARLHYYLASLNLRDYAYNSIPNQLILAGQTK